MGFGGIVKLTDKSQIANGLIGDPLLATGGVSTADLASDARAQWGRFLFPAFFSRGSSLSQAGVANRAFIQPIFVPRLMTFDEIMCGFGTVGGNVIMGLYKDNTDTPVGGSKLLDTGTVAVASPTVVSITSLQLAQGVYWVVLVTDGAAMSFLRATGTPSMPNPLNGCRYDVGSYSITDPCPGTITNDATASPGIGLRIKSVDA